MKDEYDKFKAEIFNFGMLILFCATFEDLKSLVINYNSKKTLLFFFLV